MRVIMQPVEVVARFTKDGQPSPAKFTYQGKVIVVDQILSCIEEKLAGNRMKIYRCQSTIDGKLTPFEMKYELQTCKWYLFKM